LPLEYGVLYCLYMTIDGALYRAGLKDIGGYARATASDEQIANAEFQQAQQMMDSMRNRNKTPGEKGRMMDALKFGRVEIFSRVRGNLPEQLRNQDEINRAIAEQVNYATAGCQYEGNDEEMRRKLEALVSKLRLNGADEAAREIISAGDAGLTAWDWLRASCIESDRMAAHPKSDQSRAVVFARAGLRKRALLIASVMRHSITKSC